MNHPAAAAPKPRAKGVIFIYTHGGMSQLEQPPPSNPTPPAEIRGEFRPIATRVNGIQICEHLPMLAQHTALGVVPVAQPRRQYP